MTVYDKFFFLVFVFCFLLFFKISKKTREGLLQKSLLELRSNRGSNQTGGGKTHPRVKSMRRRWVRLGCKGVSNGPRSGVRAEMKSSQGSSQGAQSSTQDQWEAAEIIPVRNYLIIYELQRSPSGLMRRTNQKERREEDKGSRLLEYSK